jgi:hypothetical protein
MNNLDSIPFSFQRHYSAKCYCCDTIKKEMITYELQIEFREGGVRTYLLFYRPVFFSSFSKNPPVIGENMGMGKRSIEELVEEIKKLIHV